MPAMLAVNNLSVELDGRKILENIEFDLESGGSLAVVGPNGAGKTVLIKALLGIIPYSGNISWESGANIGYVPQKIDADRHLPLTLENLIRAKAANLRLKAAAAEMENIFAEVGLAKTAAKIPIGHLSGGEFQKALIAFALLGNPRVLILDEPTASIDLPGEERIYELIHELQDKRGISVIVVSHDLGFVHNYATKVLCINRTKLCFGPPEEALNKEVLQKVYGPHKYFHHFYHGKNNHHGAS